jgi:MoxR-like ATPase
MFKPEVLAELLRVHGKTFRMLGWVEQHLNERFVDLEDQIHALVLSVASGEPLLLIGPPGTAKSRLIRAFCGAIGLIDENRLDASDESQESGAYFEYLLTPFTEPGELFGFFDIARLHHDKVLTRQDEGMLQNAKVVFLDEIFNASSAILNTLLAIVNERIFHDRGRRQAVQLRCLFAASNSIPETPELRAFFDRFLLRCDIENVGSSSQELPQSLHRLVSKGWRETYGSHQRFEPLERLLDSLALFREDVRKLVSNDSLVSTEADDRFFGNIAQLVQLARDYDLSEMSNRRIIKMTYIMLVNRLYRASLAQQVTTPLRLGKEEIDLLPRYLLDRKDEEPVRRMERLVYPEA